MNRLNLKPLFCLSILLSILSQSYAQVNSDSNLEVDIDKFIFSVSVNSSWRTAKFESSNAAEEAYGKDLKKGGTMKFKALIPFDDQSSALGLLFTSFKSREARLLGNTERHSVSYIGAVYQQYGSFGAKDNNLYFIDYSLGYMSYKSEVNRFDAFKGGNLGLSTSIGYRLMVSPNFGIGFDFGVEGTTVGKWKAPNGQVLELEERDNLFRIDFGIAVDIRL